MLTMNWLPLSRYAPKQTLVNRVALVACISLLGSGCHVPAFNPHALASVNTPIQEVDKQLVEPTSFVQQVSLEGPAEAPFSQIYSEVSSNSQRARSEVVHSQDDDNSWSYNPEPHSRADSNLAATEAWKFDRHYDARTNQADFSERLEQDRPTSLIGQMWDDQKNFYSVESLTLLGGGLLVGGAMANSSIDDGIHRHFQSSVRGATSDDWFESLHASKELGNGMYTLPVFATAWAAGELFPENSFVETSGRWGERSIRGFVVGAPPLIIMQQLTGGSRPTETDESSEWYPFRDNNGISGHAFMGSLPFITAAKMTENRGYKVLFYAGSAIAPLSRVNDNAHYPSQVALGWWMAYLAASAIDATDNPNARWRIYPYSTGDSSGTMAEFRY